jgi:Uma2 family endonuclease
MSPRYRHEKPSHRLSLLVLVMAEELNRELVGARSTTFQQEQAEKGLEPDECFYIANASALEGVDDIDLTIHPPPDLAIEVDLTSSSLSKESIYASLGVPELWRHEDEQVVVRVLVGDGTYRNADRSRSFPEIRAVDLTRLLAEADPGGDIALVRGFRREVRKILASPANE